MVHFSDKCTAKMSAGLTSEFAGDFFEIENAYVQTDLAGGSISKRITQTKADLINNKSVSF